MGEQHDTSDLDQLRGSLHRAAGDLPLGAVDASALVTRARVRRRRRRAMVTGVAAVTAVAAIGAVVANRDLGDDTLELANPPETTRPETTAATDASPAPTVPVTTPPTLPPTPAESADVTAAAVPANEFVQLLPWRDGFLSVALRYAPQPLPELPEDLTALFPDEVRAAFPDGLPPTIDDATEILAEAGLLDEVTAILSEHPELAEAIYAIEPPPPEVEAAFTVDGSEWTTVVMDVPTSYGGQFVASGDRLLTWSTDFGDSTAVDPGAGGPRQLTIAWTDDLADWTTATIPLDSGPALDDHVQRDTFVNSVGMVGDRWLAQIETQTWVDYEALLPDDVRDRIGAGSVVGYGTSTDERGITVDIEDGSGDTTTFEFTWAELGLDGDPQVDVGPGEPELRLLLGDTTGAYEELPVPPGYGYGSVVAAVNEFYLVGDGVRVSPDGRTWSPVEGLPEQQWFQSAVPLRTGVLLVGDDSDGPSAWLRTPDGAVTAVDLPELPERYGLWNSNGSSAWVVELGPEGEEDWTPVPVTIEHEGFTLELVEGPDATEYVLTDAAGTVIREATVTPDDRDQLWQFDDEAGTGWVVITDDAGAEIVRIPGDVVAAAYDAAFESQPVPETEPWRPDLWLLATADGANWLTLDLPDPNAQTPYMPSVAAVNDGAVLYRTLDGWGLETLPTG